MSHRSAAAVAGCALIAVVALGTRGGAHGRADTPITVAYDSVAGNVVVQGFESALLRAEPAWVRAVRVVVEGSSGAIAPGEARPPVIGAYSVDGNRLLFHPRFPFARGVDYRVEIDVAVLYAAAGLPVPAGPRSLVRRITVGAPLPEQRTTRVLAVYPANVVPSNLLRMYVELSAPMEPGTAYDNIHLVDDRGREVADALLRLDEELWDPGRRRLTVWLDPGRIKRGIRSNVEMGVPLRAGRRYHVVIGDGWRDAAGSKLASSYDAELRVGAFDATSPDPSRWGVSSPHAGTRDTLRVSFGEPLDHALASHTIAVVDSSGGPVAGIARLGADDRAWQFVPTRAWPGRASLRVDTSLEDVAGNSVARPFDSDRARGGRSAEDAGRAPFQLVPIGVAAR